MIEKCFNNLLRSKDTFDISMRLGEESQQPYLTARSSCKIQFMENGKFLFRMKDRNIAECGFVSLHSE
jgi:hypothetical protein